MQKYFEKTYRLKLDMCRRACLFVITVLLSCTNVTAQRQPDLKLDHYWSKTPATIALIKQNDDVLIADGQGYYLQWRITNNGSSVNDTIAVTDTVKIKTAFGKTYQIVWGQNGFSNGMSQIDTVFIEPDPNPFVFPFGNQNVSQDSIFTDWCDSVYIVSGDGTNQAIDPNSSNDQTCDSVFVTYWMTGVAQASITDKVTLYPNPVADKLFMKCNFPFINARIEVIDILGKVVFTQSLEQSAVQPFLIDLSVLTPGTYMFKLFTGEQTVVRKITIGN